ncbi:M3 family oligoendopeptidase [Mobilitalea sibirica]|uniref:M3 family oligoendopeptidase n=1 Tax=Mobilitalea sibirica TaxID=1462919 RepID=A0A8J7KVS9_9FIRM|nr:M3 family oligoendopeptidase [Mobilitalea sibirica]MBH1939522.1 M3 family oligoendopeptidase [Mobilitalea sibirica]
MNKEWSLDVLYKGYEDEKYKKDWEELKNLTKEITRFSEGLKETPEEETALIKAIEYMEQYQVLGCKLSFYIMLRQSVNTTDSQTVNELNAVEKMLSLSSKPMAAIHKFIAGIEHMDTYMEKHAKLKAYKFFISEIKKEAKHLLSDEVEEVIAKLNISAGSAWSSMQSFLTSTLEVEYRGEVITLPEVRNLAYSDDASVRKDAYYAELQSYEKIKDAISYSLNNIKTQVNTICEFRGYESPLAMTLQQSKMKKETLDAMLEAIREYLPVFHKYLKHKARLLGYHSGLPWFDMFAPMGESNTKFSVEDSKEYLVKHFRGFADDLADMVEEAFDNEWIDFYPKKGKVGGAFCENMPFVKQSRILSNFTGTLKDVVTLAHELGHAYHGMNIQEHLPLNVDYSMPVAETASTFNEAIIMEAAIKETDGSERIALIESQLQDVTQIICDIYSRFLFESAVFEKSKTGFLFADELKEIMLSAQKEAYGDGLDHEYLHPYMWVLKGHYYSENLSFYNFPYAFGGLFARGLYEKYKVEGEEFIPKYRALLNATTVMDVEGAAKEADINLEEPQFWRSSLKTIENLVEEFISATERK